MKRVSMHIFFIVIQLRAGQSGTTAIGATKLSEECATRSATEQYSDLLKNIVRLSHGELGRFMNEPLTTEATPTNERFFRACRSITQREEIFKLP